ncbi:MAG: amidohydrolase family protein [Verrucomicrobia bacterium]|nr:amidohydrolase family protein [Verrucomicrobiota bacterium]
MNYQVAIVAGALLIVAHSNSLYSESDANLRLLDWKPKSQMDVPRTNIIKPKFPVIDIHNHLRRSVEDPALMSTYLEEMDKAGIWMCISLDGAGKDDLYLKHLEIAKNTSPYRFSIFYRVDWNRIDEPNFGENEAQKLHKAYDQGIRGLKISKVLGLAVKDKTNKLVTVDDPRIDPVWAKCGELGIPVLIHISDPKAFFDPIDEFNERYDELAAHPEWSFHGDKFPPREEILAARNRVIARHPNTKFIGAHVGNAPEELGIVGIWLDRYPNFYVEIGARISELGRQPYTARDFMIKYQDRVLFGTDTPPNAKAYSLYFRFLETKDEYIDPTEAHHLQGRWKIYGLHLPDEVLEKVYYKNALKVLGLSAKPAKF